MFAKLALVVLGPAKGPARITHFIVSQCLSVGSSNLLSRFVISCRQKEEDYDEKQAAMKNIVYFDLETQKSADEVGGWDRIRDMRMSVGVTYSTARGGYRIYGEKDVNALIEELRRADLVVGFNSLRF